MSFCGFCGASLPTAARFCGQCGRATDEPFAQAPITAPVPVIQAATPTAPAAPAPPTTVVATVEPVPATAATNSRGGLLAVVALLGIAAVAGGIYLVTKSDDKATTETAVSTIAGEATIVEGNNTTGVTTVPVDPVQAASDQLQQLVAQDRPTADTLVGSWVVQLSAKRVGLEADGIVYGPVEILADHDKLRAMYGAIIVDGGAFQFTSGGSPMIGWFLTMVPQIYASKEDALQFCHDNGLGSNLCLAREFKPPTP